MGTVELDHDGVRTPPGPPRQRAVLACLLADAGQVVPVQVLLDRVWEGDPPSGARRSLHSYLTRIRRILENSGVENVTVEHRSGGYVLTIDPLRVDLHRFRDLVRRSCTPGAPEADRAQLLRQALALWRGRALSDVPGQWAERTRTRWEQERLTAVLDWATAELEVGDPGSVIAALSELRDRHPFTEPVVLLLMKALSRSGRTAEAVECYGRFRHFLAEELGTDPGRDLVALYTTILQDAATSACDDRRPQPSGRTSTDTVISDDVPCPYPGLRPHGQWEASAGFYCGRQDLIEEILRRVEKLATLGEPLVVMGPSGVGKTSLLQAGLLPALTQQPPDPLGLGPWTGYYLRPGTDPVAEIAAVLSPRTGVPGAELAARIRQDPSALRSALASAQGTVQANAQSPAPSEDHPREDHPRGATPDTHDVVRTLLVVDQFEELFTCGCSQEDRRITVQALLLACERNRSGPAPALVLLGMRADFYAQCLSIPDLVPFLQRNLLGIGPLTGAGLREAIEGPAAAAGLRLQPGLVETLLLETKPESLPLLSHALRQTFAHRQGGELTIAGYRASGGIDRALATTADALHDELSAPDQLLLRQLLMRLICVNDGVDDARRRVRREDLVASGPCHGQVEHLLGKLVQCRLVTAEQDSYMISHEALLRSWPRLRTWLDEDRRNLQLHQDVARAALQWQRLGHDPGLLYRGTRLILLRQWVARTGMDPLNDLERDFYGASVVTECLQNRANRTRHRLLSAALVMVAVLLLVSAAAAGAALRQRHQASQAMDTASSQRLAAQAAALMESDPDLAALLAVRSYRTARTPEALQQVRIAAQLPLRHRLDISVPVRDAVFTPDGQFLLTAGADGVLHVHAPGTGKSISRIVTGEPDVTAVALSQGSRPTVPTGPDTTPGGARKHALVAAAGTTGPQARVWEVPSGRPVTTVPGRSGARRLLMSPDSTRLAVVDWSGQVKIVDTATGRGPAMRADGGAAVLTLAFSPDSKKLITGDDRGTVRVRDARTGRLLSTVRVMTEPVRSLVPSPDGRFLVCGGLKNSLLVRDLSRASSFSLRAGGSGPVRAAFSPTGDTLAVADHDGALELWRLRAGRFALNRTGYAAHTGTARSVEFSPDSDLIITAGQDGTATLWSAGTGEVVTTLTGHRGAVSAARFSPDGRSVVTAGEDGTIRLWHTSVDQLFGPLQAGNGALRTVAYSPEGKYLVAGGDGGLVRIWETRTGRLVTPLQGTGRVGTVAFDPTGTFLATGESPGTVRLWAVPSGKALGSARLPGGPVLSLSFDRNGLLLGESDNGTTRLWKTRDRRLTQIDEADLPLGETSVLLRSSAAFSANGTAFACRLGQHDVMITHLDTSREVVEISGETGQITDMSFTTDGSKLATASDDGTSRIWDARTGERLATLAGHAGTVRAVRFSPDGATVSTAGDDGTMRLWDAGTGTPLGRFTGHTGPVRGLAFAPDGSTVSTASEDGTVRVWRVPPDADRAVHRICSAVARDLSEQEWAVYVPGAGRRSTC